MGDEFDKRRTSSYAAPSYETSSYADPANAWGGQPYNNNTWDHGNKAGKFRPFAGPINPHTGADGGGQQQRPQEQPPMIPDPNMSAPNQHWYGYYPPHQSQVCNFFLDQFPYSSLSLSLIRGLLPASVRGLAHSPAAAILWE